MLKQQVSSIPGYKNDAYKQCQWSLYGNLHTCRLVAACISLAELGFLVQCRFQILSIKERGEAERESDLRKECNYLSRRAHSYIHLFIHRTKVYMVRLCAPVMPWDHDKAV